MPQYLKKINEDYATKPFDEWDITDLLWIYDEVEDPIYHILSKYGVTPNSLESFTIDDDELELILTEYNEDYNIIIKSLMDYLIASSKGRNTSKLIYDCMTFINLYFENIEVISSALPIENLSTIIKWTIKKFPKSKSDIRNQILDKIINKSKTAINYLFFIDYFLRDENLRNIFSAEDYEKIYDYYFLEKTDEVHILSYLGFYEEYLAYLCENNKGKKKVFLKRFCDFVITNITLIPNHTKQVLLQKVRDYMDELNAYDDDKYFIIDEHLKIANEEALRSLKTISVEMPKEHQNLIENKIKSQKEIFGRLSGIQKIDKLLIEIVPISLNDLKEKSKKPKSSLAAAFSMRYLDKDGRVINYSDLNENEVFSLKSHKLIEMRINLLFDLVINPFFKTFDFNDEASQYLKEILANNKLVSANRVDYLHSLFSNFFKQDFRNSVYSIVEELEESLRFYFKKEKMNVLKRNGKRDFIGLNTIFNDSVKNSYRDKICEIIDDDFYFTMKWLLVDNYGYGLRHRIAHRYESNDLYGSQLSIYTVIQILRLYWGFQIN
ncbi:MAG TPA: hypothetical protein PKV66_04715 [Candidatus Pelethenecus sp.]|nr:hypothetical protein [Candidatus Pelethenecus sp.]